MSNPLTKEAFVRLLDKRLREVGEKEYAELPSMIPTLFDQMPSDSAWDEFYSVGDTPDIPEFNGSLSYLSKAPGFYTKIESKTYAAGMSLERQLIEDKKYAVLDSTASDLMVAAQRTREKKAARQFQNAFSSAFDYQVSEEGVSLCSSSHTTKSGTSTTNGFDNSGTSALSPTSVAATRILMKQFRSNISERINVGSNLGLIVPDNLADRAMEIVGTPKGLDTAEGNINVQHDRYTVIPYSLLDDTDTNNWFMVDLDNMKKYNKWVDRVSPEINNTVDFETYALKTSVYFRAASGFTDWRWIYGHSVS